jgi:hypothetical protein
MLECAPRALLGLSRWLRKVLYIIKRWFEARPHSPASNLHHYAKHQFTNADSSRSDALKRVVLLLKNLAQQENCVGLYSIRGGFSFELLIEVKL